MKKYELLFDRVANVQGNVVFRIRALRDIPLHGVRAGDLGGHVQQEGLNLSHEGDCWVGENAWVWDQARVMGDALVSGHAKVHDHAQVSGRAHVYNTAVIKENALVSGDAEVFDNAKVIGNAKVDGGRVFEDAMISGQATIKDHASVSHASVKESASVYDHAMVEGGEGGKVVLQGFTRVYGQARLRENVFAEGFTRIHGQARLSGRTRVSGHAEVKDRGVMENWAQISGTSVLYGEGLLTNRTSLSEGVHCCRRIDLRRDPMVKGPMFKGPLVLDGKQNWKDKYNGPVDRRWVCRYLHDVPLEDVYSVSYTGDHVLYCLDPLYVPFLVDRFRIPSSRALIHSGATTSPPSVYLVLSLTDIAIALQDPV